MTIYKVIYLGVWYFSKFLSGGGGVELKTLNAKIFLKIQKFRQLFGSAMHIFCSRTRHCRRTVYVVKSSSRHRHIVIVVVVVTSSRCCRIVTSSSSSSRHHVVTSSRRHVVMASHCHVVTLSSSSSSLSRRCRCRRLHVVVVIVVTCPHRDFAIIAPPSSNCQLNCRHFLIVVVINCHDIAVFITPNCCLCFQFFPQLSSHNYVMSYVCLQHKVQKFPTNLVVNYVV